MGMEVSLTDMLIRYGGLVVACVFLIFLSWNLWMHYINTLYLNSIDWVLLEIVPPKEVFKSPQAMELVLNTLHGGDATNWFLKYWKGELSQYYSLEIASIEGKIHFYVRFHKKFRKAFEAQLYAQYPQAQVKEAEDYTKSVPQYTKDGPINVFGYTLGLNKPDPYPIKTYVDYGLDRAIGSLDEEQRIDPITPILEIMGSVGVGEQIWMQIIMRKDHKRHEVEKDGKIEGGKSWKDKGKAEIEKLRKELNPADKEGKVTPVRPTKGQLAVIEAIEHHRNKPGFDCGIRVVYVAKKENFSGNTISAFTTMFRQFASEDLNSFKMENLTKSPDEPWKDIGGKKAQKKKKGMLADYKDRMWFYDGFNFKKLKTYFSTPSGLGKKAILLSTEELATIYHLPGRVAETPTFTRIEATKGEPPANLPI